MPRSLLVASTRFASFAFAELPEPVYDLVSVIETETAVRVVSGIVVWS